MALPLILQHEASTPADLLGEWLDDRGIEVETVAVWEDGAPADPAGRPWICALGSDQTPGREGSPPWVEAEVKFLRAALRAEVPVLGLCFGGQALAVAAGGDVHPADPPAAGWAEVETADPALVPPGPWLHFHYDQLEPPAGSGRARALAGGRGRVPPRPQPRAAVPPGDGSGGCRASGPSTSVPASMSSASTRMASPPAVRRSGRAPGSSPSSSSTPGTTRSSVARVALRRRRTATIAGPAG